ncbi:hypothetical protein [Rhizobium binxianense]
MKIVNLEDDKLAAYCRRQIEHLFPTGADAQLGLIDAHLEEALRRTERCFSEIMIWRPGELDVLHSSQYCMFLYFLSNTIWRREQATSVCTKLFLLNKALNSIDCFYELQLPEVFIIVHSVGIVLTKTVYNNRLVLFQNSTVGKSHGVAPILEENVVLYPNSAVVGNSLVRAGSVVSQGVSVINRNTERDSIVFQGAGGSLVFKPKKRDIILDVYFCDPR